MNDTADPRWEALLALFDTLVDRPEQDWREQLDKLARTDPALAAEVAAMLAADQRESGIFEASLTEELLARVHPDSFED